MLGATVAAQPVQQAINVVTPLLVHHSFTHNISAPVVSFHRTGLHVMPSIGTGVISKWISITHGGHNGARCKQATVYCPLQCTARLIKTDALRDRNNCNALLFQT